MKPKASKHRSKRLRKKLHLNEFQTLGFSTIFCLKPGHDDQQADALFDAFIVEAIEGNGLFCGGGGGNPRYHFFVEKGDKSVSSQEQQAVAEWLSGRDELETFEVGPLVDSWYYDDEHSAKDEPPTTSQDAA